MHGNRSTIGLRGLLSLLLLLLRLTSLRCPDSLLLHHGWHVLEIAVAIAVAIVGGISSTKGMIHVHASGYHSTSSNTLHHLIGHHHGNHHHHGLLTISVLYSLTPHHRRRCHHHHHTRKLSIIHHGSRTTESHTTIHIHHTSLFQIIPTTAIIKSCTTLLHSLSQTLDILPQGTIHYMKPLHNRNRPGNQIHSIRRRNIHHAHRLDFTLLGLSIHFII
mmetsp:Transcript_5631/g.10684  ORF Transcript_5631/g.10684 Transcript_5631/m.10684 type:complete len:218 (+) Transcript_5631:200-853(+)